MRNVENSVFRELITYWVHEIGRQYLDVIIFANLNLFVPQLVIQSLKQ